MAAQTSCCDARGASAERSTEPTPLIADMHVRTIGSLRTMPSILALLLALALSGQATSADASSKPSVFLANASAARVKALALDTALLQGWTLLESRTDAILFATSLDQPASDGPPGATPPKTTQLRIHTQLEQTETGTLVSASAVEHWWPGTEQAWTEDVTRLYGDHLQRALRSLQQRWEQFNASSTALAASRPTPAASTERTTRSAAGPAPKPATKPPLAPQPGRPRQPHERASSWQDLDDAPIGLWAYYAERYAQSQGCLLHDRGAVLAQALQADEIHRVYCANRAPVMVRCNQLDCRAAR